MGVSVDMLINDLAKQVSSNDYMFINQLMPVISPLSTDQRKVLIEFIELLSHYDISEQKQKED